MTVIHLPDPAIFPNGATKNSVWLEVTPKKVASTAIQTTSFLELIDADAKDQITYKLLLPKDTQETLNHSWSAMENTFMVIAQKKESLLQKMKQGTAVHRVDTPLIYATSDNRKFNFIFNLVHSGKGGSISGTTSPQMEVIDPIRNFQSWSVPQKTAAIHTVNEPITIPYVFNLRTVTGDGIPVNMFNVRAAALLSVQAVYKQPFIRGYPTSADLILGFIDIDPLYKTMYNKNIKTTTSSTGLKASVSI